MWRKVAAIKTLHIIVASPTSSSTCCRHWSLMPVKRRSLFLFFIPLPWLQADETQVVALLAQQ